MKPKTLVMLFAGLVVVVGLAYWNAGRRARHTAPSAESGKLVLPDLAVNDAEKIVFRKADGDVTFAKTGGVWSAAGKYNYPVKFEKVREFLRALADLKIGQVVRASAGDRERMNLISPVGATGKVESAGTLVSIEKDKGQVLASLLLGGELKTPSSRNDMNPMSFAARPSGGRYVARGDSIYVVSDTLSSSPDKPSDWLDEKLTDFGSYDLSEVSITGQGRDTVILKRPPDGGDVRLEGMAADMEMDSSKVNSLTSALGSLRFQDVADPALTDAQTGMDSPVVCVAKTRNGRICTLKIGKAVAGQSSGRYVRLAAEFTPQESGPEQPVPPAAAAAPASTNAPAGAVTKALTNAVDSQAVQELKRKTEEREKTAAEVKAFNDRVAKWTYIISDFNADSLLTVKANLAKKKEEQKAGEAAGSK